jgi:hypothetical protein
MTMMTMKRRTRRKKNSMFHQEVVVRHFVCRVVKVWGNSYDMFLQMMMMMMRVMTTTMKRKKETVVMRRKKRRNLFDL